MIFNAFILKTYIAFECMFWVGFFVIGFNIIQGKTEGYIVIFNQIALFFQVVAIIYFQREGLYLSNPTMKLRGVLMGIASALLVVGYTVSSSLI